MNRNISRFITACVLFAGTLCCFNACEKPAPEKPSGAFDVELVIPFQMEVNTTDMLYTFDVRNGKAPQEGDKLMFANSDGLSYSCLFTDIAPSKATIKLSSGIKDGNYTISIKRGNDKKQLGKTEVKFFTKIDFTPAASSTVYGVVSCEGAPVKGAVISDGVDVTVTDANGIYEMASKKAYGYVFISVPSGYKVACEGILPMSFVTLTKGEKEIERADFSLSKIENPDNFKLLVFGDMHLANRTGDKVQFLRFVNDVNNFVAAHKGENLFGITLGDMTWDQFWYSNKFCFEEYLDLAKGMNLHVNHTIGNHDHDMMYAGDFETVTRYRRALGPNFYSYNLGQFHIVALDDIECTNSGAGTAESRAYNCKIVADELEWLEKDLAHVPADMPVVITLHAPLYTDSGTIRTGNAETLLTDILAGRQVHIYSGHTHVMYNVDKQSASKHFEHNAGAVCATWWWSGYSIPGIHVSQDGTPGGYMVVDVKGKNMTWQYKGTDMALDKQFRTYDGNCVDLSASTWCPNANSTSLSTYNTIANTYTANSSNYVYINVWDYDPSWKVEVTENGKSLNVTKLSSAYDPLHAVSYTAKRANANGTISFPTSKTKHMFRVQASTANSALNITVTDRFGNVYTETMSRPKAFTTDAYKTY